MQIYTAICLAFLAYLIGSFSTATAVSDPNMVDIRHRGSNNPGSTNVMRVMGVKWGLITFVGDLAKTAVACGLSCVLLPGTTFGIEKFGLILAAFFTIIGHNWPIYYNFSGGKGVACSICAIAIIDLRLGLMAGAVGILTVILTRYISLGSLIFMFVFAVLSAFLKADQPAQWIFASTIFLIAAWRHKANIQRLIHGTENKFKLKGK